MPVDLEKLQSVRAIVVYGPVQCDDCDAILATLAARGISATKVVIKESHAVLVTEAIKAGILATPLVFVDDSLIFGGGNIAEAIKLARSERALLIENGLLDPSSNPSLLSR